MTFTIAQATATVTFDASSLTQTYDGSAHFATATTVPAGLTVDLAYQQNGTPVASPTNAGDYDVTATINDPNYQGTASDVLHIAQATATVTFDTSSLTQTYDGSARCHGDHGARRPDPGLRLPAEWDAGGQPDQRGRLRRDGDDRRPQLPGDRQRRPAHRPGDGDGDLRHIQPDPDLRRLGVAATATTVPAGLTLDFAYQQNGTPVASPTNAGDYDVTATIDDPNYQGTASDVLHIAQATATVTFDTSSLTQTYDGSALAATATTVPAGLTLDFAYQQNGTPVASPTNAGDYDVTATIDDPNYQGTASDVLHIAQATATLSFDASSLTQTYDGTARVVTVTTNPAALSGVSITYDGSTTAPTGAGTYDLSATLTNANYQADPITGTLTVAQATISGSFTAASKVYDGGTSASILTRTFTTKPFGTDNLTLVGGTASFANKNVNPVGTPKTVTGTGFTLGGTDAGNYQLASSTLTTTANITPATISGSFTAASKVYDGGTSATILTRSFTTTPFGTDNLTLVGGTASFANKNVNPVGTPKTVTGTGFTLGGTDAGNYQLASSTLTTTANITPATISGSFTAASKVYDGGTSATILTRSFTTTPFGTDNLTLVGGTASFANKNVNPVGTPKTVTGTGFTLGGTDAGNYQLASSTLTTTANITPRALTVSATGVNKVYDGTTNATVTLSDNRVAGDVLSDTYTTASFADASVGNNKPVTVNGIAISGTDAGNYTLASTTATTKADITPASLTVIDPGFEQPVVGTGAFEYDPTGSPWVFTGGSGISGNNSAFTSGNPPAPQGVQVAFLQGTGSFTQSVTGWAAGSYVLTFDAAQRGNFGVSQQNLDVLIDGSVVGTFKPSSTSYQGYSTASFTVTAGTHTIEFQGLDSAGGDNTAFLDQVAVAPSIGDPGFEQPAFATGRV